MAVDLERKLEKSVIQYVFGKDQAIRRRADMPDRRTWALSLYALTSVPEMVNTFHVHIVQCSQLFIRGPTIGESHGVYAELILDVRIWISIYILHMYIHTG